MPRIKRRTNLGRRTRNATSQINYRSNRTGQEHENRNERERIRLKQTREARHSTNNSASLNRAAFCYDMSIDFSAYNCVAIGPMNSVCQYCKALKYKNEANGLCCANGKLLGCRTAAVILHRKMDILKRFIIKSQLEHVLLRPDTYTGAVEHTKDLKWGFYPEMVQKKIIFVPTLYKFFDEILVNAADNKQRDTNMSCIKIDIDPEKNLISVWNNGKGTPVVMHKTEKMFVPTMIFGHMLTLSNCNDAEQKFTRCSYNLLT